MMFDFNEHPHRRQNPLTGEWVKVSPHRTKRPWQGQVEKPDLTAKPAYDPGCYLCPGNSRSGGFRNPSYADTFVFDNDFAALLPDTPAGDASLGELLQATAERGICKVICFSPRHDLTLARMEQADVVKVIDTWQAEYRALAKVDYIGHVQIFENRGEVMGCSNPHPHCQIWAEELVPDLPATEIRHQDAYFARTGSRMLLDYARDELKRGDRVVVANADFVAVVPFWAVWPFETLLLPLFPCQSMDELNAGQKASLAEIMRRLCIRYDNLFSTSFPYSMGFHQLPTNGQACPGLQLHAHYYPPLLRSASVKKFMVGYEMLGMPQRDLTAEQAAKRLRDLPELHYASGADAK
jgi:UDPglucose--hexose-1-phosphate uridylyltransferase